MAKSDLPSDVLTVETYDEVRKFADAFVLGHYTLLGIIGSGGIGKTETVRRRMTNHLGDHGHLWQYLKGHHAPLDLYGHLYRFRLRQIVCDDMDGMLENKINVGTLKSAFDSTPVRIVDWGSSKLGSDKKKKEELKGGLPKRFETISKVCLLCNDWGSCSGDVRALLNRGRIIRFKPSVAEVHREIARGGWFAHEDVFNEVAKLLPLITTPSFRFYTHVATDKKAGHDWKALLNRMVLKPENKEEQKLLLVAEILQDKIPTKEQPAEFEKRGGGSRATYFRYKSDLLDRRGDCDMTELRSVRRLKLQPLKPTDYDKNQHARRRELERQRDAEEDLYDEEEEVEEDDDDDDKGGRFKVVV
jgi:hypothetical protein